MSLPPRFRVGIPEIERERLTRWFQLARGSGRHGSLVAAAVRIDYRLAYEADSWGASVDYLPDIAIRMRRGRDDMLIVTFGVHDALPEVFVKEFRLTTEFHRLIAGSPSA